ncbi:hypothetical protein [Shewanella algidipiscicola]|uniref:Uncharacterized protein n=1 Tax=Shewanella algidipiscicola TaxID=614070 RepID=A0ABQ4PDE0_9GAMM|nr:hypothetical protein [Shewanella algidipiscicola]GIU45541.1 hypothetical protein TUM4630_13870 [Shewanella algidipiscicola]
MQLSNARRWARLCEQQAELVERLSTTFPERKQHHEQLGQEWRLLADKIRNGESPKLTD